MIGEYARLTPAELGRAVRDPSWALEFIYELIEAGADETAGGRQPRCLDIDKAWDTLGFLLRRIEFPVDIVHGEEKIPGAEDWGYGPPRYLPPDRVHATAAALGELPSDALVRGVKEAELAEADLYPNIAGEGLQWLKSSPLPGRVDVVRDGDAHPVQAVRYDRCRSRRLAHRHGGRGETESRSTRGGRWRPTGPCWASSCGTAVTRPRPSASSGS